jgi:hypothetical protein
MTITYDKQILIKRGNTASVSSYVGPLGELVLDTDTNQVYVHDGATVGGTLVGDDVDVIYGDANVAAYIPTDATIISLVANAAVQAGQISQLQTDVTTANTDMKGYVDTSISANVAAIIGGAPGALDTLNELANALGNNASFSTSITNSLATLTSNAAVQAGLIADTNTAITTANLAMKGYVDTSISSNIANIAQYSDSSVAAYLPTYNGNIKLSNVTFSDLSVQRTAYTGQSWRTLLESNLQTKPTWLAYVPDGSKPTVDVNFGFDSGGMWFTGNANDQHAYPIRTNVSFYDTDATEIIATFDYDSIGDDHGIAIFNSATTQPFWRFGTDSSRIAWQISTATPELRGQTTSSVAGAPVLVIGNTYTIRMVYDPLAETNRVTVELYQGTGTAGTLLDTRTINETLPAGAYEVGFDADQDNLSLKSYFTALTIKTLTNAVFNDIEVINDLQIDGTVTGNLIPSANVTYSLGNETHQWKDLWVSSNTIYINSIPLSIDTGGTLLVNGAPVSGSADITFTDSTISAPDDTNITIQALDFNSTIRSRLSLSPDLGSVSMRGFSSEDSRTFDTFDWSTAEWVASGGGGSLVLVGATTVNDFINNDLNYATNIRFSINGGTPESLESYGYSSGSQTLTINTTSAPETDPTAVTEVEFFYTFSSSVGVDYDGGDVRMSARGDMNIRLESDLDINLVAGDDVRIEGADSFRLINNSTTAPIRIITDDTNNSYTWAFNSDSTMTFPDSTVQTTAWTGDITGNITVGNSAVNFVSNSSGDGNGYTTIQLIPDNNLTVNDQYLIIDPTEPTHIHIRAGGTQDNSNSALFLGGENSHVEVQAGSNPPVYVRANNNEWMFDVDGNLTVPGSVIFTDPSKVSFLDSSAASLSIGSISSVANIAFSDNTYQTTAWTGTVDYANVSATPTLANVATSGDYTDLINTPTAYGNTEVAAYLPTYTGNIAATVDGYTIGYREVPQVAAGNVTLALSDSGKHYYSSAATPTTLTIPSNANVAFPIGTAISIINAGTGNITISKQAETSLYLAGNTTNATRTLTSYGMATALKTAADQWFINGTGLE